MRNLEESTPNVRMDAEGSSMRDPVAFSHTLRNTRAGERSTITTPAIATTAPGSAVRAGHSFRINPAKNAAKKGVVTPRLVVNTEGSLAEATPKARVGTAVDTRPRSAR